MSEFWASWWRFSRQLVNKFKYSEQKNNLIPWLHIEAQLQNQSKFTNRFVCAQRKHISCVLHETVVRQLSEELPNYEFQANGVEADRAKANSVRQSLEQTQTTA